MPTKADRRQAKGLVETLEARVHAGPAVGEGEIQSAREFLRRHEFSPVSDYFDRLERLEDRLRTRSLQPVARQEKRNYGGEASGCWMQLQSVYDHVILSTCYSGEFRTQRGRVKISHRFNQAGRIDFVELKFLRSLQPCLTGEVRKLLMVKSFQSLRKEWRETEAFVLRVLPQELVFLFADFFRLPRAEALGWLVNFGHRTAADLRKDLRNGHVNGVERATGDNPCQLPLIEVQSDAVALPILEQAALLESAVELSDEETATIRYNRRPTQLPPPQYKVARHCSETVAAVR
ncbi:MAG: hypothetical protein KIS67_19145 [Verrucomicrobiae bacterium]|nr:hypothetical protein [Verrucomicrobiae bacterium]